MHRCFRQNAHPKCETWKKCSDPTVYCTSVNQYNDVEVKLPFKVFLKGTEVFTVKCTLTIKSKNTCLGKWFVSNTILL